MIVQVAGVPGRSAWSRNGWFDAVPAGIVAFLSPSTGGAETGFSESRLIEVVVFELASASGRSRGVA
jgi:hypothetical protein